MTHRAWPHWDRFTDASAKAWKAAAEGLLFGALIALIVFAPF